MLGSGINVRNLKKSAQRNLENYLEILPAYIYEASIRGINFSKELQELHGRTTGTNFFNSNELKLIWYGSDTDLEEFNELPF